MILKEFLRDWRTTGTVAPSSRFLQDAMSEPAQGHRIVVELGPGTGCITEPLLQRLPPDGVLVAVEINERMATTLRQRFSDPRLRVVCDSAANLPAIMQRLQLDAPMVVVSGLPFASLPATVRNDIVAAVYQALAPGGLFVAFQYAPIVLPPLLRQYFGNLTVRPVVVNLPPALVYSSIRTREDGGVGRTPCHASHVAMTGRRAWQEGLPYMAAPLAVAALLWRRHRRMAYVAGALGLGCAAFFRDPEVRTEADEDDVVSAATGWVMAVDRVDEPWWIGGPADRVAVFLSLFDVHVNRFPISGRMLEVKRVPGAYAPAMLKSEHNCRDLLGLEGSQGRVMVAQISGLLARRSVQWHPVNCPFTAGQRLGMIRFGSRTDVYLPAGKAQLLVRPGDRVLGGITRIARYMPF